MVKNNTFEAELVNLIAPIVAEKNLFLEEIRLLRAGKHTTLRVTVDLPDGPGGVNSDQLDEITRAISDLLDLADPINGEYNLEVTTPGTDRKLTTPRHYSRAIGRLTSFQLVNGEKIEARIESIGETGVVVVPEKKVPKSDKVIFESPRELNFEEVKAAHVLVELKKLGNQSDEGE